MVSVMHLFPRLLLLSYIPMVLSDLHQPDNLSLGYNELLKMAASTDISMTSLQAAAAEKNTRVRLHLGCGFTYKQEG